MNTNNDLAQTEMTTEDLRTELAAAVISSLVTVTIERNEARAELAAARGQLRDQADQAAALYRATAERDAMRSALAWSRGERDQARARLAACERKRDSTLALLRGQAQGYRDAIASLRRDLDRAGG